MSNLNESSEHQYMMLSRLKSDCEYYVGRYGHGLERTLYTQDVESHIQLMKDRWNALPEDGKPMWLSMQDILDYESVMLHIKANKMLEDE